MEIIYKRHTIRVSGQQSSEANKWKPHVQITWGEGKNEVFHPFTVDRTYDTQVQAEIAGFDFAKKWIDRRKPSR